MLGVRVAIPPVPVCSQSRLTDGLLQWLTEADEDSKSMMIHGLYALWLARNDTRDGRRIEDPALLATRVKILMDEWRTGHETRVPTVKQVIKE